MDDEQGLRNSLEEYENQLHVVEQALALSTGHESTDLIELKKNLEEVIFLTKESLGNSQQALAALKPKSLEPNVSVNDATVQASSTAASSGNNSLLDDEFARFQAELHGACTVTASTRPRSPSPAHDDHSQDIDETLLDMISALEGHKCQAPFSQEWGELSFQNALVFSVTLANDDSSEISFDNLKATVMFCNPTCDAMKPCSYFLDGRCRYADRDCRYSHGNVVSVSDLREYVEPDYSMLQRDSACLAKSSDGLWHRAVIEDYLENQFVVKYIHNGDVTTLNIEDILPCTETGTSSDSDDDTVEHEQDVPLHASESSCNDVAYRSLNAFQVMPTSQALGEWEKHTTGIGSKLMAKMGYVFGKGLGKNESGRTEPIPIVVLPTGKSLDKCMQLREIAEGKGQHVIKKEQKKVRQKLASIAAGYKWQASRKNVFDFINSKIASRKGGSSSQHKHTTCGSQEANLKTSSAKGLNVRALQVNTDMKQAKRELARLRESLARNKNRDKVMEARIMQSIANQQQVIQQLHAQDRAIQKEQQARKSHQKLAVF